MKELKKHTVYVPYDKEFQDFILNALEVFSLDKLAVICDTSKPTIDRWSRGKTCPPSQDTRNYIKNWIEEAIIEEGKYNNV